MMTEKTLKVPDMSCGHCKAAVESELNKISGVMYSKADVEKGTVEVSYDEGEVSTADLKGAIEGAGYTLAA
jgi:copper chaperone